MNAHRIGLALIAGMTVSMVAAAPLRTDLKLQPESKIWVSGKSSVKDYKCQAKTIDASGEQTAGTIAKLVSVAEISVPVATLECGNGTMNGHMKKALKMTEFPNIVFKMSSYVIGTADDITVNGTLSIAGKDLRVELQGKVVETDGVIRATATKDIDMTQWGVKPPSLMLGTMKVKPVATIGFDIAIKR